MVVRRGASALRSNFTLRESAVWIALAMAIVAAVLLAPGVIAFRQWPILLRQAAPLGLLALGQTILIIGRGFDLSVGGVVGFVNVLAAGSIAQQHGAGAVIAVSLAVGLLVGLTNGLIVGFGKVSPLVATLGTGFILTGAMLIYTGGAPTGTIPDGIRFLSRGRVFGMPIAVYVWLVSSVLVGFVLKRTWLGTSVYVFGSSPVAAEFSGIRGVWVQVLSHVASSILAVIGGLLLAGFVGIGTLGAGQDLMMKSLAATVVGGTILIGGVGGVLGTVGGVILLTLLSALLTGAGVGAAGNLLTQGLVLLGAASLFRQSLSKAD